MLAVPIVLKPGWGVGLGRGHFCCVIQGYAFMALFQVMSVGTSWGNAIHCWVKIFSERCSSRILPSFVYCVQWSLSLSKCLCRRHHFPPRVMSQTNKLTRKSLGWVTLPHKKMHQVDFEQEVYGWMLRVRIKVFLKRLCCSGPQNLEENMLL